MKVFSSLACLRSGLLTWCVPMECLLVLEDEIMEGVGGRQVGEDLCDPLGTESERKGR